MVLGFFIVALVSLTKTSDSVFASRYAELLTSQTTAQESKQTDVRELKVGAPIERELPGGGTQSYRVMLTTGQYFHLTVEQKGIDVVVRLFGPESKKIAQVDNDPTVGSEYVIVIAEASGEYRVDVQSSNNEAKTGRYEIKIDELRNETPKDRIHADAERAVEEGIQLRDQQTAESRQKAIKKYEEALPLWRDAGDKKGEAFTLNQIGVLYSRTGQPKKAVEYYEKAIPLWHAVGDLLNEATTLTNMGIAYARLGEVRKALELHRQAQPLARSAGDPEVEALTLSNAGSAYWSLGEPLEALRYYEQALPLTVDDRRQLAVTLNNIAMAYTQLGELQKATEYLGKSLPLRRLAKDKQGEATVLHNLGLIYRDLGDLQMALKYYNQALEIRRAVGDRQGEAVTLQSLSTVYTRLGDLEQALKCADQALTLTRAVGDRNTEAYELSAIGKIHELSGEPKKALDTFEQALSLRRAIGDRYGEAYSLSDMGNSYLALGNLEKALEYYRQSLTLHRDIGDKLGEVATLYGLTRAQSKLGNNLEALAQIRAAIDIIESTRGKFISQQLRTSFSASRQDYYQLFIDLLMRMHGIQPSSEYDAAALQASERARARSLLELLAEAHTDIRQGVDPVLLERERSLQQQLNAKSERLTRLLGAKHSEEQETGAMKEVEAVLTDYQDLEVQIRAKSPRYAALTQPQALSLKEIQQVLDKDTLLLEYSLGEERSYLWAVTPTSVASFELPKRADIEAAATKSYEAVTARNKLIRFEKQENKQARVAHADAEYFAHSAILSQMLLGPVAGRLGGKRLLIVSDGALQYLPFGALPVPSPEGSEIRRQRSAVSKAVSFKPLMISHEVISLPSASALALLRKEMVGRQRGAKTVAVFADPVFQDDDPRVKRDPAKTRKQTEEPSSKSTETRELETEIERSARDTGEREFRRLPYSRQEAEKITALAPIGMGKESLDFEANRATATSADLSNYRIIHFATHGLLDSQHPELSGIVLSLVDKDGKPQDGFLRLNEIYNLKLGADLVVLSACRTALGKEIRGEGLVGLTRGFMYAGAPRVVASLWAVDDEITAELMKRFYGEMLVKKQRPAAALRAAQISIWKERRLTPYFWAAFVLQGEWK